jgi:hypothetical protein
LAAIKETDFAAFAFAPDDIVIMREEEFLVTRDNVIFELGVSVGVLGIKRCFIVRPKGGDDFHLPSDLAGIQYAEYQIRDDDNLAAAFGPACFQIRESIDTRGNRKGKISETREVQSDKIEIKLADFTLNKLIDQKMIASTNLGCSINEGSKYVAQTYTAGINGLLMGISIDVSSKRSLNPDQHHPLFHLNVAIYDTDGTYPRKKIEEILLDNDESRLTEMIVFRNPIKQIVGEKYAIVVHYPDAPGPGPGNWIGNWNGTTGNFYKNGELMSSPDGKNWRISSLNDHDVHFLTYVNPST